MNYSSSMRLLPLIYLLASSGVYAQQDTHFPYKKQQPIAAHVQSAALADKARSAAIKRGAAVARAADCSACHTATAQHPYAGGYQFDTGVGVLYSSNITSDPDHGIGDWTYADFAKAIHKGESKDGHNLYPAMPFAAYQGMTEQDTKDLWAYIHALKPDSYQPPDNDMSWPFSMRWGISLWKWTFVDDERFTPDQQHSDQWNRGDYLVNVLGHCGSCHTERNIAMAKDHDKALQGAVTQGWYAPSLLSGTDQPLDKWDINELTRFLGTGVTQNHFAAGPMREAVEHSLQYLSVQDRQAIALYLKTLRKDTDGDTVAMAKEPELPSITKPAATSSLTLDNMHARTASFTISDPVLDNAMTQTDQPGAALYRDNCSACHLQGQGMPGMVPNLAHSTAVTAKQPNNLLQVILHGARNAQTEQHPTVQVMPAFNERLSDQQIAQLVNYLHQQIRHDDSDTDTVTAEQVAEYR